MARSASVPDDAAPTVSAGGGGGTPMGVQASPNAFGAQVGGAVEKVGSEAGDLANKFTGMIMETAANQAETGYIEQAGKLTGQFKSLEGLQAQAAIPKYEQDMVTLRQSIRASLPGGAARMFDANTNRHESYALSDAYSYGAQQVKKANLDSNNAIAETAVSRAGDPTVAGSDAQFGNALGNITHSVQSMMDVQGYGEQITTDPETGKATFKDTPEGKQAQSVYQSELDKRTGAAWENRLHSLSDQNVESAYKTFQANRDSIPGDAQVKLDAYFTPKIRDYQARNTADDILSEHTQEYQDILTGSKGQGPDSFNLGNVKTAAGAAGGTSDFVHPANPTDGVTLTANNLRKNYDGLTLQQIASKWTGESPDKVSAWLANTSKVSGIAPTAVPNLNDPAQLKSLLTGIATAEKSPQDRALFTSDVLDKGIQASISGQQPKSAEGPFQQKIPTIGLVPSQADYYRSNYDKIVQQARDQAQSQHPDDPTYADAAASKVEQRMSIAIKGQELSYKADNDTVMQGFNGELSKGTKPTTVEQLRAINPDVAAAWDRLTVNNPNAANAIENRILTANAKGTDKDLREYGSGFYKLFQGVHADSASPDRISNVTQLYSHVGEGGDLTVAGLEKLKGEIEGKGTPEGSADSEMKKQFFANAKAEISGKNDTLGIPDKKGEEQNLKFMAQAFPLIDKLKTEGKSAAQIYNPDSPDYVGKLIPAFKRPLNVQLQDINRDAAAIVGAPGERTTATILGEARATKDPDKLKALKAELLKMGAIRDDSNESKVPRSQ